MSESPTPESVARDRRPFWVAVSAVTAGIFVLIVVLLAAGSSSRQHSGATTGTTTPMMRVAPGGVIDIAALPPATADEYRYAETHADAYAQLACYCGCVKTLGHRSLEDCFVRPAGGYEAHGSGCAVCLGEAADARQALDAGTAVTDVRATLDAKYGPSTPNDPSTASTDSRPR